MLLLSPRLPFNVGILHVSRIRHFKIESTNDLIRSFHTNLVCPRESGRPAPEDPSASRTPHSPVSKSGGSSHSTGSTKPHSHEHNHDHDHSPEHVHSHGHSLFGHVHRHSANDNVLLQESGGLRNPAIRITWIGLIVNIGMAVGKGIGGVVFHSQALVADSIHAISDLVSDFLTLATVSIGPRGVSTWFPHGYGKVETVGSLGVSTLLLVAGVSMGWSSCFTMLHHIFGDIQMFEMLGALMSHSHSHSHESDAAVTDVNAAWLALGSIGIKEWLFNSTMKVAKRTGSPVLVANAWHHRVDSLVSVVSVATIGSGYFFGINWMDPLGGLLVSSIIVRAGYTSAKGALLELVDSNKELMDPQAEGSKLSSHRERVENILQEIHDSTAIEETPYYALSHIYLMPSGANYLSFIELRPTRPGLSLDEFRNTTDILRKELMEHDKWLKRVTIEVSPEHPSAN